MAAASGLVPSQVNGQEDGSQVHGTQQNHLADWGRTDTQDSDLHFAGLVQKYALSGNGVGGGGKEVSKLLLTLNYGDTRLFMITLS